MVVGGIVGIVVTRLKTYSTDPLHAREHLPMDRKLLDILACPATRQPLAALDTTGLQAINRAIVAGVVVRGDGSAQAESLDEALITQDRKLLYRIDDGIPVLLIEDSIAFAQADAV